MKQYIIIEDNGECAAPGYYLSHDSIGTKTTGHKTNARIFDQFVECNETVEDLHERGLRNFRLEEIK